MNWEDIEIQVKTFYGLEAVLAEELRQLGGRDVKARNRVVSCRGDLGFLYKINYSLRTGLRVLVPIFKFRAYNEHKYYQKLVSFNWEEFLNVKQSFAINATVHSEKFRHSQFMMLRCKDAIADSFMRKYNRRPSVSTINPDIEFDVHIDEDWVTISLNSSGEPLFKRGYRQEQTPATLNEVLAAGMLKLAGWEGKENFLDPMCGSGTLPIEAAMVALNLPAQIFRKDFSFTRWNNFDKDLFQKIKEVRLNRVRDFKGKIRGYDIDRRAVSAARQNVMGAELEEVVTIEQKNFFETEKEDFPLVLVFNPPYDERLKIREEDFYQKIGDTFKNHYPNTLAWLITSNLEAVKQVGLHADRRIKLFNGKLECRFMRYDIYEGTRKNK